MTVPGYAVLRWRWVGAAQGVWKYFAVAAFRRLHDALPGGRASVQPDTSAKLCDRARRNENDNKMVIT